MEDDYENLYNNLSDLGELVTLYVSKEELDMINEVTQTVSDAVLASPWPQIPAEAYFIWMYSVQPFAEA